MEPKSKKVYSDDQKTTVAPKYKMSGTRTILHHLFRAELANFKKNRSWKKDQPDLTDVPHVHFYHTVNSTGKVQQYTAAVGGHFHEVEWRLNPETGEPEAKCGPPLKKVAVPGPDGLTVHEIQEIEFVDKVGKMGKRGAVLKDTHTHKMSYERTDEINSDEIRASQSAARAQISDGLEGARAVLASNQVLVKE